MTLVYNGSRKFIHLLTALPLSHGFFPDFLALKVTGSNLQKLYLGTRGYESQGQGSWDTSEGHPYLISARVVLTSVLFGLGYSNA